MVLDGAVKTNGLLHTNLVTAVERALSLDTWVSRSRDRVASDAFVRRHTEFDSLDGFCAACPCDDDTIGAVQRLDADERNAFVARTTDFATWTELKRGATVENLVSLQKA